MSVSFQDPETDIMNQFLGPETDIMKQFLGPETDIMGEGNFMKPFQAENFRLMSYKTLKAPFLF